MQVVGSGQQAQPALTELPALPDHRRDRLKTIQLMKSIQRTAHRFPLKVQKSSELVIGEEWMCQQQAQDAPLARCQAQRQQGYHLPFLQALLYDARRAVLQVSHDETPETNGCPQGCRGSGRVRR